MKESKPDRIDWAKASGDIWAKRWRDTDRGLAPLHPHLISAVARRAPKSPFRAFDVGCGPGSTSIAIAEACPAAAIVGCDVSPALVEVAKRRVADNGRIRLIIGDAETVAPNEGPFDLIFSRHGVMFFDDPVRAFRSLRSAARRGASLVFSCFQAWELNPWASELASVAAGEALPMPGREPGGFAFADPDYVRDILNSSGWDGGKNESVEFRYVAAEGDDAVADALSFMTDIGPASRILQSLPEEDRGAASERMRAVLERQFDGNEVVFPAAAWLWTATAS
jgi:SAM-dependent methyltransferase